MQLPAELPFSVICGIQQRAAQAIAVGQIIAEHQSCRAIVELDELGMQFDLDDCAAARAVPVLALIRVRREAQGPRGAERLPRIQVPHAQGA